MLQSPLCKAFLIISGENLNPSQISERLNIQPDYNHDSDVKDIQGNEMGNFWQIHSKIEATEPLETHISDILKSLAPARHIFKDAIKGHKAKFYCSVEYSSESKKGFALSPKIMALIGSLGVELEIDSWNENEDSDSDSLAL